MTTPRPTSASPNCKFIGRESENKFEYTKKAAELGLPEAQHNLGIMYFDLKKNKQGIAWQLQAAKQSFYPSMINIGTIFLFGKSEVLRNPMAAYIWFKTAEQIEDSPQLQELINEAYSFISKKKDP